MADSALSGQAEDYASALVAPTKQVVLSGQTFAYREFGEPIGTPIVLLNHLAANLDNWDPSVLAALSNSRHVLAFDNAGVGASSGRVPATIDEMAEHAAKFIAGMGFDQVDVVALSMGGMVAQSLALSEPALVRKLVLVGTGPRGGRGIARVSRTTFALMARGVATRSDPKEFIFFNRNATGKAAAKSYLARLAMRNLDSDKPIAPSSFMRQLKAIRTFGTSTPDDLSKIQVPTLVINGDSDIMVPTELSKELQARIPGAGLVIYPDAGHGSLFQHSDQFAAEVLKFLA